MTVQGDRTGAEARQEGGAAEGNMETIEEAQGGRARTVNGAARLSGAPLDPGPSYLALSPKNRKSTV